MLLAVLGVQLGYLSADDVLAGARELAQPGELRTLSEFLVARGMLDRARAQVLERLAARACTTAGGDAAQTLELLPASVRKLAAQTRSAAPAAPEASASVVEEQPHRYFSAPRADAPPRELGRGAFGRVVSMHDTVLGRDVAWKQAFTSTPESDEALMAQARLLARLDHPAVVPIYELGRDSKGAVYATQRQVSGDTLAEAITRSRSVEERLMFLPAVHSIARCVAMAHEVGVTHRRLNCGRISLGRFGEVYLLGWGPPEDESSRAEAVQADVKALGAILHEVVTGLPAPVMGAVRVRGAPEDLLGLCRGALGGSLPAEQFAHELKAFIDGRRLGSYRYSSWQLLKRYVQRHTLFSVMALTALVLVALGAATAEARVREERDRARLFARRFLDDVALRLRPQPGVEPLLEQVTTAALRHYQRTTDLQSAPREERLRVARAMARLGVVSLSLSRLDEAAQSLDFADVLAGGLAQESAGDAEARVVLAQTAAARAGRPGQSAAESARWAERARKWADLGLSMLPDSLEARRAAASARLQQALHRADRAQAQKDFDDAVQLLELPAKDPTEELARRDALGAALIERASWRAKTGHDGVPGAEQVLERLRALRERAPDDLELQLDAARATLLLAEALEPGDAAGAQTQAALAAALAREVVTRRPDRLEASLLVVRATLLAGQPKEALEAARAFEARGMKEVAPLLAEAALFSGDFETARTVPLGEVDAPAQLVLVRALASAWLDRPSDAVIQARALKTLSTVDWAPSRLSRALDGLPMGRGQGEGAVRRFAAQWRERGADAALAQWVTTLEGQLAH
jgi:hypothetical protein